MRYSHTPDLKDLLHEKVRVNEIRAFDRKANPISLSKTINSKYRGQGLEFLQVRKYFPGDDVRNIDWKVSARVGETHVKEFKEEKDSQIFILMDMGANMQFASKGEFKYFIASKLTSLLSFASQANSDKINAFFYGKNLKKLRIFRQRNQKDNVLEILDFLSTKRELKEVNQENNLLNSLKILNSNNKAKGVAFIISDFFDLSEDLEHEIKRLNQNKIIYLCHIYDQLEKELPLIRGLTFSDYENQEYSFNASVRSANFSYKKQFEKKLESLKSLAKGEKVKLLNFPTTEDPFQILLKYL